MRNRAFLPLMEQAIMILVFALAAALCLRTFVWADGYSARQQARDQAVTVAQNAAETLQAKGLVGGTSVLDLSNRAMNREWRKEPNCFLMLVSLHSSL